MRAETFNSTLKLVYLAGNRFDELAVAFIAKMYCNGLCKEMMVLCHRPDEQ